jgi:outer membrane protein
MGPVIVRATCVGCDGAAATQSLVEMKSMNNQRLHVAMALLALTVLTHAPLAAQSAAQRIAVVDSRRVLDSMPGRSAAEAEFGLEQAKARTMVRMATDSMKVALEQFQQAEATFTPKQREAAMMLMRARELTLEDMVAQLDAIIERRMDELQAPLRERIRDAVKVVRARRGYALVLDLASASGVIDADVAIDITSEVVAELRRR